MLRGMLAWLDAEAGDSPGRLPAHVGVLWDRHLAPQARADGVPEPIIDFLRTRMMSNNATGLVAMGRYLLACQDRTAELAALDGPPILVLYGEHDDAWRSDIQETMARQLRARRVCIPGVGHSPAVEAPETTASTLTGFWGASEEQGRRGADRKARGGQSARAAAPAPASA
jgi:pimeloyl-ACP methyl ester carboxylesterase